MNYRKQKKILKKELRAAIDHQEQHPVSRSAWNAVANILAELRDLKYNKKRA